VPKVLLPIPYQPQQSDGDCLAACAAMALAYLGQPIDYAQLLQLLEIKPYGAPAGNICRLARLNLKVAYSQTDMSGLVSMLQDSWPVIVFVNTKELPYWSHGTDHALLVVGCDESQLYVNDPAHAKSPIAVPKGDFELAWLARDYYYALITPMHD